MQSRHSGTAIVLQFANRPALEFTQIVNAFDTKMRDCGSGQRNLIWDCDDIAMLDRGPLRVALGWVRPGIRKNCWYLVIVIGPSPDEAAPLVDDAAWTALADRIIDETKAYLPFDDVFRSQVTRGIDADLIDFYTELVLSTGGADPARRPDIDGAAPRFANMDEDTSKSRASWSPHILRPSAASETSHAAPAPSATGTTSEDACIRELREILTSKDSERATYTRELVTLGALCLTMFLHVANIGGMQPVYTLLVENVLRVI